MGIFNKLFSINRKGIDQIIVRIFGFKLTFTSERFTKKYCISREEWIDFIEQINGSQYANEGDSLFFLRDKTILLNRLGNALNRDFIDISNCTYDDFVTFTDNHKKFIAKVKTGCAGNGMKIYDLSKKPRNIDKLYKKLKRENTCLLEEYIQQCELLNRIYPKVVSTIRIYTLNIEGNVELISYPLIRIPTAKTGIKNEDLITMKINPDTAICPDYCIRVKNNKKSIVEKPIHPYSKYPLSNFKVPYFEEIKQLVLTTAQLVPEIVYAGWDIAITDNGPVIIEGNGAPYSFRDENFITTYEKDIPRTTYYKNILDYYNFRKNLTQEKIDKLSSKVFLDSNDSADFDIVIILGSSRCEYRAQHFCDLYKNKTTLPIIIASGGNNYSGEFEYKKIYNILKQNNIPDENIYLEKKSKNSIQNLKYSFELINKLVKNKKYRQIKQNGKIKVGIVTAGFHSVRINRLVQKYRDKYEISVISAYGEHTSKDNWYKSYIGYGIITNEIKKID